MALTLLPETHDIIDLPECIARIDRLGNPAEHETIEEAALYLKMLSNNKTFLIEHINQEIKFHKDLVDYQCSSPFPQQIIDLGQGSTIRVRANIWLPQHSNNAEEWERNLFAYHRPHDHPSNFLTVGYYGPGYKTDIYEYNSESTIGYPGEPVRLTLLEKTSLSAGKTMYYRKNRDIHSQLAPDALSVSINILYPQPSDSSSQYWFDIERSCIVSHVPNSTFNRFSFLCKTAAFIGGIDSLDLIAPIASSHSNPYVRVEALQALSTMDPASARNYWEGAYEDPSEYVRFNAASHLSGLGVCRPLNPPIPGAEG